MFNLFRDFDQELTKNAKLQHLFQKINCDGLSNRIATLEYQHNLNDLLFDQAINHKATILSKYQIDTRFSQVSSAGSTFDRFNSKYSRGRGRGGNSRGRGSSIRGSSVRGRGRGRGRGGKWVEPHLWAKMTQDDRDRHKFPPTALDTNTISMISAIAQATIDNMKILPKDNSSNSTNNTDARGAGNSFRERNEAQANKRRNNSK